MGPIDNLLFYLKSQLLALPNLVQWGIISFGVIMITREVILWGWRWRQRRNAALESSTGSAAELPPPSPVDLADPIARMTRQPDRDAAERRTPTGTRQRRIE